MKIEWLINSVNKRGEEREEWFSAILHNSFLDPGLNLEKKKQKRGWGKGLVKPPGRGGGEALIS